MAQYNTQYILEFTDIDSLLWRVELALRDGPIVAQPAMLEGSANPLKIERRNNEEDPFAPIIPTQVTIQYTVRDATDPAPELFFDVDATQWLVTIYKGGNLYWRGHLDGKTDTYDWLPYPYTFQVSASDFEYLKGVDADVNQDGILFYDYISIGQAIDRTLFRAIQFPDPVVRILYTRKPDVIGSSLITEALYTHTDWLYLFNSGPINCYDAILKLVQSLGARMFYEDGAFWIQFLSDIPTSPREYIEITPDDLAGTTNVDVSATGYLSNSISASLQYSGASQQVKIGRGLKSQSVDYDLKVINKLLNFDWRDNTQPPFAHWQDEPGAETFYSRIGSGSAGDDTFRLIVPPGEGADGAGLLSDVIPAKRRQVVELTVKNRSFITLPLGWTDTLPEDYRISVHLTITLSDDRYFLSSSGTWISGTVSPPPDLSISFDSTPGKSASDTTITSAPIPTDIPVDVQHIAVFIYNSTISPEPPPGTTYYTELYPVALGVFSDRFTNMRTRVVNNAQYSLTPDNKKLFFIDTQQDAYSNALFYLSDGNYLPIPTGNWTGGRNLEELTARQYMDMQSKQTFGVMGSFIGNSALFRQNMVLVDKGNKPAMIVRDNYSVRSGIREAFLYEILPVDGANQVYTLTQINDTNGND